MENLFFYQKQVYSNDEETGILVFALKIKDTTVIDILNEKDQAYLNPFPVGRLDKDTEGFMLLTNDGELAS